MSAAAKTCGKPDARLLGLLLLPIVIGRHRNPETGWTDAVT
jgi:hypothetical protein